MDPLDIVGLARALIDIDSTTGREEEAGRWLAGWLRRRGWTVTEQPVDGVRTNVLATLEPPVVVLSTHYDCVPPHVPSGVKGGLLYGRGSCDAKGILAAQVAAAERLAAEGERRVGLLFLVGEERGSDGARAAAASPIGSRFLLNGEPTDNRLGIADEGHRALRADRDGARGALRLSRARGVGHRKARRRHRRAQGDRLAFRSRAGRDDVLGRADRRGRRAECRAAGGLGRSHVPHGRRRRGDRARDRAHSAMGRA